MKVDGERRFAAPRETVWNVLQDPAQMAAIMPGVESFDIEDDKHWKANVKIPLGLGSLKMSINFEKLEEDRPQYSKLNAKGTGVGALMTAVGVGAVLGSPGRQHGPACPPADREPAGPAGAHGTRRAGGEGRRRTGSVASG